MFGLGFLELLTIVVVLILIATAFRRAPKLVAVSALVVFAVTVATAVIGYYIVAKDFGGSVSIVRLPTTEAAAPPRVSVSNRVVAEEGANSATETAAGKPQSVRAPSRPKWVDEAAGYDAAKKVYRQVVTIGPYATADECQVELPGAIHQAVLRYVRQLPGIASDIEVDIPPQELEERFVRQRWEEPIQASFGPMVQLHVQLEFDEAVRAELRGLAEAAERRRRLAYASASAAGLIGLIAVVHGALRWSERRRRPALQATA